MIVQQPPKHGISRAEKREDDLEAEHLFNRRIAERTARVRAEADEAASAEVALKARVDELRGDVQLGLASRNDLLAQQKLLAKAQSRRVDAASAVKAAERLEMREREERDRLERELDRRIFGEVQAARRAIEGRIVPMLWGWVAEAEAIESEIAALNAAYRTRDGRPVFQSPLSGVRDDLARRATNLERRS